MPHDNVTIALSPSGEIGPLCNVCNKRMTFGESMVHNEYYLCWEHYQDATGASSITDDEELEKPFFKP